jgi:hypothetical protein
MRDASDAPPWRSQKSASLPAVVNGTGLALHAAEQAVRMVRGLL